MDILHNIVCELTNTSASIENLRNIMDLVERSPETDENNLRASINLVLLYLESVNDRLNKEIERLDGYWLEKNTKTNEP